MIYSGPRTTSCWARCDERNKRVPIWASEHTITSPAGAHGFVKLHPFPCESHRSGIQLDEPFASVVCAAHPSLCRRLHASHRLVQGMLTAPVSFRRHLKRSFPLVHHTAMDHPDQATLKKLWTSGRHGTLCPMEPEETPFPPVEQKEGRPHRSNNQSNRRNSVQAGPQGSGAAMRKYVTMRAEARVKLRKELVETQRKPPFPL